ncbi:hypothetical protein [Roseisolibacter agri]|uniref:Uncharacterized protein n=1 Tax=Roseisolibacter agri TaxID=2014610 RepID=A0AA37QJU4_9BACT|nr:hypothetical protein [Roseisolibacter agri]GLC27128.1 hypothetical protein rosag_36410 [Roseisolibacter agri]
MIASPLSLAMLAAAALASATRPAPHASPRAQDVKVVATLVASSGGRLQGTLTLTKGRKDGETRARVEILNGPANAQLGWIIRKGQCGERGAELGPIAAYRPLQTRGDGSMTLAVNLPIALPSGDAYHVDILQERGSDVVIACGGLSEDSK